MDQPVTLQIDGRDVAVRAGTSLLEAAKQAGIEVPSLCNQEKLLPAGLCRLCLVEIEKVRGLQPACSSVVREGMVVHTDTPAVLHNRRMVLELLCTNHPLDCPVCDAAGDCRLQDYVFRYGRTESRFVETKRHKGKAIPLGPAVILDQERCVLCQRCVRFCEEVLDDKQLGVFQRGASSRIATLPGRIFDSIFSGNVIDLCPVGAMTDRVFRFKARTWELESFPSTCRLCPAGCRLTADARNGRLLRMRGREAPEVNDGWLCDLGRTGLAFVDHPERLRQPLVRRSGRLQPATWGEALAAVAHGVEEVLKAGRPQALAALGSPLLTNEAAYLLSKLMRAGLGTNNVDSRLGGTFPAPAEAGLAELRGADVIVLFQGDPAEEAPILELWIKQAARRGGRLFVVHPRRLGIGRYAALAVQPRPGTATVFLAGVLAALAKERPDSVPADWRRALADYGATQVASLAGCGRTAAREVAAALAGATRAIVAYGTGACDEEAMALLVALGKASGARLLGWNGGPNARGVADAGLRPDRLPGQAALDDVRARASCERVWGVRVPAEAGTPVPEIWQAMKEGRIRALFVAGADPLGEAPDPRAVGEALDAAALLVVQDAFLTATASQADVVLPAALPNEEDGSATNLAGRVGWHRAAIQPLGQARPHWRILADVARGLSARGRWDYAAAADVLGELCDAIPSYAGAAAAADGPGCDVRPDYAVGAGPVSPVPWRTVGPGDLALVTGALLFDRDALVARVPAIAARAPAPYVELNPADAQARGIAEGSMVEVRGELGTLHLQARLAEACLAGTVFVPEHLGSEGVSKLGARPGVVVLVEVKPCV